MTPSKEALKAAKAMVGAIIKNPFLTDIEVARVIDSAFAARMKAAADTYPYSEIEAACGGETAVKVRKAVMERRSKIDSELHNWKEL